MIISICNEKGGSGKTNLAVNLAVKFATEKIDTLVIDADPQRSVEVFTSIRENESLPIIFDTASKQGAGLTKEIKRLSEKYEAIVIDTGGRDSNEMRQSLIASNLVIIPVVPSDYDIAVLNKMLEVIDSAKAINEDLQTLIVISKASPNPFLANKINSLKEYIKDKNLTDIKLANTVIYEREAYRNSLSAGKGIIEYCKKDEKAFIDFENLIKEIME